MSLAENAWTGRNAPVHAPNLIAAATDFSRSHARRCVKPLTPQRQGRTRSLNIKSLQRTQCGPLRATVRALSIKASHTERRRDGVAPRKIRGRRRKRRSRPAQRRWAIECNRTIRRRSARDICPHAGPIIGGNLPLAQRKRSILRNRNVVRNPRPRRQFGDEGLCGGDAHGRRGRRRRAIAQRRREHHVVGAFEGRIAHVFDAYRRQAAAVNPSNWAARTETSMTRSE